MNTKLHSLKFETEFHGFRCNITAVRLYNASYDNSTYERQFGAYVDIGGIVGHTYEGDVSYVNCENKGIISASLYNGKMTVEQGHIAIGGIAGVDNKGEQRIITNCSSVSLGNIYIEATKENYLIYKNWDIGKTSLAGP